ncbi:MAG: MMPL family transporter [candidate division KSB1 bacterium]|nr:MMPL family transporter [candidate division KSB1 bacterium]
MSRLFRFVVNHPKITLALILIVTVFFSYSLRFLKVETDIASSLPQDIPAKRLYDRVSEIFPSKEVILVMAEADDFFQTPVVAQVKDLTHRLEQLAGVHSVLSPTNAKVIRATPEGIDVREAAEELPETPEAMVRFRQLLLGDPLFTGTIISRDGRAGAILVFLKKEARGSKVAAEVLQVLRESAGPAALYAAGKPVVNYYLEQGMNRDWSRLMPAVLVIVFFLPYLRFRSIRLVLLPFGVVVMSVLWTLGTMALVGSPLSHSTTVLPILLMSIGVADGIHILSRYHANARGIRGRHELVLATMEELRAPVIITSLTTMAGFLALNTSRVNSLLQLGIFTAFGVFVALILSLTFLPACLVLMPVPEARVAKGEGWLDRAFRAYGAFLVRGQRWVMLGVVILILVSLAGLPRIVLESNDVENFPEKHPVRVALEKVNQHFGGATTLEIVIEGKDPDDIKDPRALAAMAALEEALRKDPLVGSTISIADYVKTMHRALHGGDSSYYRIPTDTEPTGAIASAGDTGDDEPASARELIAQYLQLYEMSAGPEDFSNLVDYEYRTAKVTAFLRTNRRTELLRVDGTIRAYLRENPPPLPTEVTGSSELYLAVNELVVAGQFKSILVSLGLVFLLTALMFRSVVAGFFNVIPLFFGILLNFAFMGWAGLYLNLMTMVTSSIAIGVGVDYAIHFCHRYQRKIREGESFEGATVRSLDEAGTAIFLNAATVAAGFAVLLLSQFRGIVHMGLLITLTMCWTGVAALSILPVLLMRLRPVSWLGRSRC